jgi:hypothetical protein
VKRRKRDPMAPVLTDRPDLIKALERLGDLVAG